MSPGSDCVLVLTMSLALSVLLPAVHHEVQHLLLGCFQALRFILAYLTPWDQVVLFCPKEPLWKEYELCNQRQDSNGVSVMLFHSLWPSYLNSQSLHFFNCEHESNTYLGEMWEELEIVQLIISKCLVHCRYLITGIHYCSNHISALDWSCGSEETVQHNNGFFFLSFTASN